MKQEFFKMRISSKDNCVIRKASEVTSIPMSWIVLTGALKEAKKVVKEFEKKEEK